MPDGSEWLPSAGPETGCPSPMSACSRMRPWERNGTVRTLSGIAMSAASLFIPIVAMTRTSRSATASKTNWTRSGVLNTVPNVAYNNGRSSSPSSNASTDSPGAGSGSIGCTKCVFAGSLCPSNQLGAAPTMVSSLPDRSPLGSGGRLIASRNQANSPPATSCSLTDCAGVKSNVASGVSVCSAIAHASSPAVSRRITSGSHTSHRVRMNGTAAAARRKNGRNIAAASDSGAGRRSTSEATSDGSTTSVGKPSPVAKSAGEIAPEPREFPENSRSPELTK